MAATMLTGCGGSDTKKDSSKEAKKVTVSDGGKVLNIRVWNEEFKSRMTDHYPGYEKVSDTEGKIGDVTVKWTITPSDDNAYQNALDEALKKQDSAAADDKIDLFLVEADYALKYVDTNYTLDVVNDLGVSKDALAYETSDSEAAKTYVNVIAVKEGNENSDKIKALVDVLKSDEIKDFINEKYDGAVIPFDDSEDAADEADAEESTDAEADGDDAEADADAEATDAE